ncbi:MAG: hypothetical protein K0M73_12365, partial [Hydrogenophaga sp.]|nr:hypothetical protein [Hydrogenophaga sp.]
MFFATLDDLAPIFEEVERKCDIAYTLSGLFESPEVSPISGGLLVPALRAEVQRRSTPHCPAYVVTLKDAPLHVRTVSQRSEKVKYAVDLMANPEAILLRTGSLGGAR